VIDTLAILALPNIVESCVKGNLGKLQNLLNWVLHLKDIWQTCSKIAASHVIATRY